MDDNQLKEIFRRAAELSNSVPEHLREAAFNRAVDALLNTPSTSSGDRTQQTVNTSSSTTQAPSDTTNEGIEQKLHKIDRTAYPELLRATRTLDRALIVLYAVNKDLEIDGLTANDIALVLKEKFRRPTTYDAIRKALDRAEELVDRTLRDGQAVYRLMGPGEDHLESLRNTSEDGAEAGSNETPTAASKRQRKVAGGSRSKESYSLDRNLNLRGGGEVPSFRDFYDIKKPKSKAEFNAVAVYYLERVLGLDKVTLNHVFTCYKEVGQRPAEHFKQSFIDARSKRGYVDFDADWNLSIPHMGQNFVEHDLPAKPKKKKG